jgi:hypothetical protein
VEGSGRTDFQPYLREAHPALNADTEPIPAGFDKAWLEPLDSLGYLVDMNHNLVRDTRDTIEQAYRRRARVGKQHGVLDFNQPLTHYRGVACVARGGGLGTGAARAPAQSKRGMRL